MSVLKGLRLKAWLVGAVLACGLSHAAAATVDVAGVKYEDKVAVAGKELSLNGAGVRTKLFVKVYAAGLYLQSKEHTVEGVMKAAGPRRIRLTMLRDVSSDSFGDAFMGGLNANVSGPEKTALITQISKYGEMFAQIDGLKKGDTLDTDWIPGVGAQSYINGKKIGEALPEINFYNAVLRIWLGEKPVDRSLKPKLLAPSPST